MVRLSAYIIINFQMESEMLSANWCYDNPMMRSHTLARPVTSELLLGIYRIHSELPEEPIHNLKAPHTVSGLLPWPGGPAQYLVHPLPSPRNAI